MVKAHLSVYYFPPLSSIMIIVKHLANRFIQQPVSVNEECGFRPKPCVILQGLPRLCVGGMDGGNCIPLTRLTASPGHSSFLEGVSVEDSCLSGAAVLIRASAFLVHEIPSEVSWAVLWDPSQGPAQRLPYPESWTMPSPTWMQSLQALPCLCSPSPLVPRDRSLLLGLHAASTWPSAGTITRGKMEYGELAPLFVSSCTVIISGKRLLLSGLSEWVTLTSDYLIVKCLPNFRP